MAWITSTTHRLEVSNESSTTGKEHLWEHAPLFFAPLLLHTNSDVRKAVAHTLPILSKSGPLRMLPILGVLAYQISVERDAEATMELSSAMCGLATHKYGIVAVLNGISFLVDTPTLQSTGIR